MTDPDLNPQDTPSAPSPVRPGAAPVRSPLVRPDAEQWDVTSEITGRTYRIYVAAPVDKGPPPADGYPVVYLTDGDFSFHTAADSLRLLSAGAQARPAIVVGIGYGKGMDTATLARFTDLTPSAPDASMVAALKAVPSFEAATYGEAEGFHRFLTEELRPLIEAAFNTDKGDNTLWGHSLGGLFGLHVLFNHPEAYNTYLVGTPSILWNNHAILKDEPQLTAALASGKVAPRVLFTVGGLEETVADDAQLPPGMTLEQMREMMKASGAISNVVAMAGRLQALDGPAGYEVEMVTFDGETHISVIPAIICRGLRFALKP